jgi:hypothetical protein
MKTYLGYFKEDADPTQQQDVLKNPSLMHSDKNHAYAAAQKMASQQTNANDRAYILSYKYFQQEHLKRYVVVYNKTLLSQAPDYEKRGYTIIGWVSQKDGPVVRTGDGKYIKGQIQ